MLAAQEVFQRRELRRTVLLGELGLDGQVDAGSWHPCRRPWPPSRPDSPGDRALAPIRRGEAGRGHRSASAVASLSRLVAFMKGDPMPLVEPIEVIGEPAVRDRARQLDLADVVGQVEAKWACEVAAAGRHHMLFHGPPGVGKTMLAERMAGLLPDLELRDSLEVSAVHSLAGFNLDDHLITRPPYSDPTTPLRWPASSAAVRGWRSRRDLLCPQGCAVPRRGAGVSAGGDRGAADAVGVGHDHLGPE